MESLVWVLVFCLYRGLDADIAIVRVEITIGVLAYYVLTVLVVVDCWLVVLGVGPQKEFPKLSNSN
jgi:hypothetical protein